MKIRIGMGTTLRPSVQSDIDYVESHFREGERLEHAVFGNRRTLVGDFESCWTVRHGGDLIGYFGIAIPRGMGVFAPFRWLCYMSCENANKYKLTYVRQSREILKRIVALTPEHVTEFRSMPAERYAMSVKWHERVLKMKRLATVGFGGEKFAVFGITREEALA